MNNQNYFLSFSIGPVQEFISSARTVRDLWAGSYILSWLTAKAISLVRSEPWKGDLIYLKEPEKHPLIKLISTGEGKKDPKTLLSCLPNYFIAEVNNLNDKDLNELQKNMVNAVREEWLTIAEKVKAKLDEKWTSENLKEHKEWDCEWKTQIKSFWEIRTAAIPYDENALQSPLVHGMEFSDKDPDKTFKANKKIIGFLDAAKKMIRHYPPHESSGENGETRPKCSLCGTFSQMGPRAEGTEDQMKLSKEFWEKAVKLLDIPWERIQTKDRFCFIHLVKRFAWNVHFSGRTGFEHLESVKRVWDTATIAAMDWMKQINPDGELLHKKIEDELMKSDAGYHWSGHWLHWNSYNEFADKEGGEPECPENQFIHIKKARKKSQNIGLPTFPPSYYAILALDGDHMGEKFPNSGREQGLSIGTNLIEFATDKVKDIIEKDNLGTLVYCGGDDVLALAPTATILPCAKKIHDDLLKKDPKEEIKSSGGIAVAHYKFDLRDALEAARKAEKKAKNSGRDCLGLTILRRSGVHTTAVLPWDAVETLQEFIKAFQKGETDRWSYQLRREWDMIVGEDLTDPKIKENIPQLCEIIDSEMKRLLNRSDNAPENAFILWGDLYHSIEEKLKKAENPPKNVPIHARDNALTLIQSASFLARGREEE